MAPNRENIWTVFGPEFENNAGRSAIVVRDLYSLKSTGASFRSHLAQCMQEMGYQSCHADSDLWMKAQYRPDNKLEYYFDVLWCVDDILCTHHDLDDVLNKLNRYMPLKLGLVGVLICVWAQSLSTCNYIMA